MERYTDSATSGMGFAGLLGLLFIALKLMHFIDWSWWLVLLPLYAGIAIIVAFILIVLFIWLAQIIINKII